jgi:F-type H+-transporting ATPase subunit gamma
MKLISAAKLKTSKQMFINAQDYAQEIENLIATVSKYAMHRHKDQNPLLHGNELNHYLLVAIGSDRGLCGSFNSGLAKDIKRKVDELKEQGALVGVMVVGSKIYSLLKSTLDVEVELIYKNADLLIKDIEDFVQGLISRFRANQFGICLTCYNKPLNALKQEVVIKQLIPLNITATAETEMTEFEQNPDELMDQITSFAITNQFYLSILAHQVSEHGSRMQAMDNATQNAEEIINATKTLYNRLRQAAITTELMEIIAGAESVRK